MKPIIALKLFVVGALIVAAGYLLRGNDLLTALALVLLCAVVLAKTVVAVILRRGKLGPGGGRGDSSGERKPRPPGGRPPALSAAEARHEPAA